MSKPDQFTAQQFIDQIPGSSGIISTIAKRVGCSWLVARKYIDNYPTIKAAFEAERESLLDIAESVVANNIKLALKQQQAGAGLADSQDAKWVLSRLGKHRGYSDKQEVDHTGKVDVVGISLDEWRKEQERRRKEATETLDLFKDDSLTND